MMRGSCDTSLVNRKRPFWATQPCACPSSSDCGVECCSPGLEIIKSGDQGYINSSDWVRGLVLNILNTEKRKPNSVCGVNPAAVGGHWSESFIDGEFGLYGGAQTGYQVGTSLYQIDTSKMRVNEALAYFQSVLQNDMQKLVLLGVAISVRVTVSYAGSQTIQAEIEIDGPSGAPANRVSLIGIKDADMGYYWST